MADYKRNIRILYLILFSLLFFLPELSAHPQALRPNIMGNMVRAGETLNGASHDHHATVIQGERGAQEEGGIKLELAFTLANRGRYEDAYATILELLIDDQYQLQIAPVAGVLTALLDYFGEVTARGRDIAGLLDIIKQYRHDSDQSQMRSRLLDSVRLLIIADLQNVRVNTRSLIGDGKIAAAKVMLHNKLSFYHRLCGINPSLAEDPEVNAMKLEIDNEMRNIALGDPGFLNAVSLQAFDGETGEPVDKELRWVDAHQKGEWHGSCQILITDQAGRVLVQERETRKRRDISATGHLHQGEGYEDAAIRIIRENTGLSSPRKKGLSIIRDKEKKIGSHDYEARPGYDETGVFRSYSRDKDNKEICRIYLYVADQEELSEILAPGNNMKKALKLGLQDLRDFIQSIKDSPDSFASSASHLFAPKNINIVYQKTLLKYFDILLELIDNPTGDIRQIEDIIESSGFVVNDINDKETLKAIMIHIGERTGAGLAGGLDEKDPDFNVRCKAVIAGQFKTACNSARVTAVWANLSRIYKGWDSLDWRHLAEILGLMERLGAKAQTIEGRACLHALLLKEGVVLERDSRNGGFVFKDGGRELKGVSIDRNGNLQMGERIQEGINSIRRGAIAADMDLTKALRDKNIDGVMLRYDYHFHMLGIKYAVVSGNELGKQYRRSMIELIPTILRQNFIIYANGAGLKVVFSPDDRIIQDSDYLKKMGAEQLNEINKVFGSLLLDWCRVMHIIAASGIDIADLKDEDIAKIKTAIGELQLSVPELKESITQNIRVILKEMQQILARDTSEHAIPDRKEREKLIKGKKQLEEMLSLAKGASDGNKITRLSADETNRRSETWPFIDLRNDIEEREIIQVTLKPVCPSKARELLADTAEFMMQDFHDPSPAPEHIRITRGGSTSIDATRQDVNKGAAAEDLIKGQGLANEDRDLVLAIDDEMTPGKVGFPFLEIEGITVISNERTRDGRKRVYSESDRARIKAAWFWTGDYGFGYEVEGTKRVYQEVVGCYIKEIDKLFNGEQVGPAIRSFKQSLASNSASSRGMSRNPKDNSLLAEIQESLGLFSARFRYVEKKFDVNRFNYPYPSKQVKVRQGIPIRINTRFKYLTFGPEFLGKDQKRIAMIVQVEGGSMFGEEIPCREFILVLEKDTLSGKYKEKFRLQLGQDTSDWIKVEAFKKMPGENKIQVITMISSRYTATQSIKKIETYEIRDAGIIRIKTQIKPVLSSNSKIKIGL